MFCLHRPFKFTVQYLLKTYNNNGNPRGTLIVVLRWSWILFQRELQKGFTSNPFIWDTRKWWELSVYSIRQFRLLHANWTGQSDVKTKTLRYCLLLPALNVVQLVIHHRLWNPPTSLPYDTWKLIIYELDSVVAPYQPGWFFTTQSPNSVTNDSFGSRFRDRAGEKKSNMYRRSEQLCRWVCVPPISMTDFVQRTPWELIGDHKTTFKYSIALGLLAEPSEDLRPRKRYHVSGG